MGKYHVSWVSITFGHGGETERGSKIEGLEFYGEFGPSRFFSTMIYDTFALNDVSLPIMFLPRSMGKRQRPAAVHDASRDFVRLTDAKHLDRVCFSIAFRGVVV
jgi:hypothetical protein